MQINKKIIFGITIVFILALSRVLPHPPNFTPLLGMAFFAGAVFDKKIYAYCIPILAMLISDLYLYNVKKKAFQYSFKPVLR